MACISFIVDYVNKNTELSILEIGSRFGESIQFCLDNLKIKQFISVDPFVAYNDYAHDDFCAQVKSSGDELFLQLQKQFITQPVTFIRKFSNDAHCLIDDKSLDVVFIDGNHSYKYVVDDIKNYLPKIKSGGIICGDDYFMRHNDISDGNGYNQKMVYEAVQDCFEKNTIIELGEHNGYPKSWLIKIAKDTI